jgi:hypothetical protein
MLSILMVVLKFLRELWLLLLVVQVGNWLSQENHYVGWNYFYGVVMLGNVLADPA